MPGILPMKVIKVGTSAQARIAQACDRCRSKKIRCDGFRPCCSQCANVGFECKTSDKLSRRAFPRGYTESLEERVRALETEVRELKDLLDAKDDKIDMLSKIHSSRQSFSIGRRSSSQSSETPAIAASKVHDSPSTFTVHQCPTLHEGTAGHDPYFTGTSNGRALIETLKRRAHESGKSLPEVHVENFLPSSSQGIPDPQRTQLPSNGKVPPRMLTDQMVNIFFQEWAPLFPVLHRPTFLALYETYVANPESVTCKASLVQLNLVFGVAALSNKTRIAYDTSIIDKHWLNVLSVSAKHDTLINLQCLILAQLYCFQLGDSARLLHLKSQSVVVASRLGLNQSQRRFTLGTLSCETRKKVFWTLYVLDTFSAAFTGIPMLLNDDNIQTEYPIDVDDEYISEQGLQPVLPGEFTKISSALALTRGSRLLAKVLKQLYPSSSTYEISMQDVTTLSEELDDWSSNLPPHLKMVFAQDKPSTHVISSRSPLLSLTYHYIRTLIHRAPACGSNIDQASASVVSLASSSKSIIQILQLLEERNLSFTLCLNKNELLVACGCSLLLQTLSLPHDSKLMKDSQRVVLSVIDMLKHQNAICASDFQRLGAAILPIKHESKHNGTRPDRPVSTLASLSSEDSLSAARDLQSIAYRYTLASAQNKASSTSDRRRATAPAATNEAVSPGPDGGKRFRAIAPSTQRQPSRDVSIKSSRRSSAMSTDRPQAQSCIKAAPKPNLDYFSFSNDPSSARVVKSNTTSAGECTPADNTDWDNLLATLGEEQAISNADEQDWPSINELLSPLQDESGGQMKSPSDESSPDQWTLAPPAGKTKPQSLLSFSDESLTSGEEFSSIDWGSTDNSTMTMPTFTPEDSTGFGLDNDTPVLVDE